MGNKLTISVMQYALIKIGFTERENKMENIVHSVYFTNAPISNAVHHHDCHQILFVVSGSATVAINGKETEIAEGNILISSRFEDHCVKSATEDYCRYILRIEPQAKYSGDIKLFSLLFNRPDNFNNMIYMGNDCDRTEYIFKKITEEQNQKGSMYIQMCELLINELFIYIYRHTEYDMALCDNSAFSVVLTAQNILAENYGKEFTLKDLSMQLAVSPSYLSHGFKKITGMSPMNYLFACRIAEAKKQLARTDKPVGMIAEECGFSDFSNFSRIFKRTTGMSPSEYIKKYRRN